MVAIERDNMGNTMRWDDTGNLYIKLVSEQREKNIGMLLKIKGSLCYFKNEKEQDVFHKTNAWSINYEVLKIAQQGDKGTGYIRYRSEDCIYEISVQDAIKYGDFLWFKTSGFEKKIYVPKTFWKKIELPTL